jgi:hypothetical protein
MSVIITGLSSFESMCVCVCVCVYVHTYICLSVVKLVKNTTLPVLGSLFAVHGNI